MIMSVYMEKEFNFESFYNKNHFLPGWVGYMDQMMS